MIGGSLKTELTRETLNAVLLDGFFPACEPTDLPGRGKRIGLTEIGLPYAADPAITRHLARFLGRQAGSLHTGGAFVTPSAVLFNGGVFKAPELRNRVVEVLSSWAGKPVPSLETADLDLAVALGAAYYGLVRQGKGIRIRGGVSRAYYVGVETSAPAVPGVKPPIKALCVVKMGMEEGTESDVPGPEFGLVVGEPAEFRFLGSTTRRDDAPARSSTAGRPTTCKNSPRSKPPWSSKTAPPRATPSLFASTPTSPRSARSNSGVRAPGTIVGGNLNTMCGKGLKGDPLVF